MKQTLENKKIAAKNDEHKELENIHDLPYPSAFEYFKGLSKRIISIDYVIDEETDTLRIIKQIIRWNIEDMGKPRDKRDPIYLLLFCFGGDADLCTALIDAIQASETPVIGVNLGVAHSAAAYVFISCHKRYMMERASLLFHQGSAEFGGTYQVIMAAMEEYEKKVDKLSGLMRQFTKIPEEEIDQQIVGEWYMYAEEAVEKGAADYIAKTFTDIFMTKKPKTVNYHRP